LRKWLWTVLGLASVLATAAMTTFVATEVNSHTRQPLLAFMVVALVAVTTTATVMVTRQFPTGYSREQAHKDYTAAVVRTELGRPHLPLELVAVSQLSELANVGPNQHHAWRATWVGLGAAFPNEPGYIDCKVRRNAHGKTAWDVDTPILVVYDTRTEHWHVIPFCTWGLETQRQASVPEGTIPALLHGAQISTPFTTHL
jgi:hypothetical protein